MKKITISYMWDDGMIKGHGNNADQLYLNTLMNVFQI